ncbi:hypothetical protein LCGC14_1830100 [marine sediment metagenome]|uniref:Uncharacterized protein n=1 Tax=marine sediment metagenome TaxID=412755 RepID=A0A0F9JFY1_9ZZZZ
MLMIRIYNINLKVIFKIIKKNFIKNFYAIVINDWFLTNNEIIS